MSRTSIAIIVGLSLAVASASDIASADSQPAPMTPVASLKPAHFDAVRTQVLAWLATRSPSEPVTAQAQALWQRDPATQADDVLDRLARTIALVEPRAQSLVEA